MRFWSPRGIYRPPIGPRWDCCATFKCKYDFREYLRKSIKKNFVENRNSILRFFYSKRTLSPLKYFDFKIFGIMHKKLFRANVAALRPVFFSKALLIAQENVQAARPSSQILLRLLCDFQILMGFPWISQSCLFLGRKTKLYYMVIPFLGSLETVIARKIFW